MSEKQKNKDKDSAPVYKSGYGNALKNNLAKVMAKKNFSYDADKDKELLAQPPHDKIYWAYLTAMIDFANGEYNKYQNTMQVFNSFFSEFMRWFALNYHPADTHMEVYV